MQAQVSAIVSTLLVTRGLVYRCLNRTFPSGCVDHGVIAAPTLVPSKTSGKAYTCQESNETSVTSRIFFRYKQPFLSESLVDSMSESGGTEKMNPEAPHCSLLFHVNLRERKRLTKTKADVEIRYKHLAKDSLFTARQSSLLTNNETRASGSRSRCKPDSPRVG
jgi:hypothetical protein